MVAPSYDVIVAGGGTAGCVLAARLSADPGRSVLLVEAGPDYPEPTLPAELADGAAPHVASHMWGLVSQALADGRTLDLPRGRVTGGCSTINAGLALRGSPADYDAWAAAGLAGWSFADVLPYFTALETDLDFGDRSYHGSAGPIPVRRFPAAERSAVSAACLAAMLACGLPEVDDHNAPGAVGAGPLPMNVLGGRRLGTASTYLAAARDRPNLDVLPDTVVHQVRIESGRATGVVLAGRGTSIAAGVVIVSAGTYHSPALLLRSGIGPAVDLRGLDIDVIADLSGVGDNLVDHSAASVDVELRDEPVDGPLFQVAATLRSSAAGPADGPDLQLLAGGPIRTGPDSGVLFVAAALLKPHSRGRVRLRSADALAAPAVDLGYFREPDDLTRLAEGVQWAHAVTSDPALAGVGRSRLTPELTGDAARSAIRGSAWTYHHPVGTCRMGVDPEAGAVVDAAGRVYGVEGLFVVDASIMPDVPAANTNLATIMVAERLAADLVAPRGSPG